METSSTYSFHSTRSQSSSISDSPSPTDTIFDVNDRQPGVPIETTCTSQYVAQLNNERQLLGLNAKYEIDGDQETWFGGSLQLGSQTITMDDRWPSKKTAKEALAKTGLAVVSDLNRERAEDEGSGKNWIGLLNSFHQYCGTMGHNIGPIFTEYSVGTRFACTCLISLHPTPFGSESESFPSKKAARTSAARDAMEYLIFLGYATSDGKIGRNLMREESPAPAVSKQSKTEIKSAVSIDAIAPALKNPDASYGQKVNELCPLLGLNLPHHRLEASGSSLYSGYAFFLDEPLLQGPIGEVENIFGKKNAKEEIARGVCKALIVLAAQSGISGVAIDEE